MNSLDLYRSKVGQSELSPSENLCQILTCVPRTGTVNLNAVTFEINPQIHLRALFESISGPSIIELNLSGQNLANQIPLLSKCLDNLSNLEKLYLTNTRLTKENFKAISCRTGFFYQNSLFFIVNIRILTLVHGNKPMPICTAIRPSSKILKVSLHRIKAKPENSEIQFASQ